MQSILEQHGFELHKSIHMQFFLNKPSQPFVSVCYTSVHSTNLGSKTVFSHSQPWIKNTVFNLQLVESGDRKPTGVKFLGIQNYTRIFDCMRSASLSLGLFKGQLYK